MNNISLNVSSLDKDFLKTVYSCNKKILVVWALDCALRVLPYFENDFPNDSRPKEALDKLEVYVKRGDFKMSDIRQASLNAHASAREVGKENAASFAARSAGQAVASAHVSSHSMTASLYALKAVASASDNDNQQIEEERSWQIHHLNFLKKAV